MSKVLLFSDLHIFQHKRSVTRLYDCLKVLNWVCKTAIDRGIKDVIFLGDLFHNRRNIDVLTYHCTFKVLSKYFNKNSPPPFNLHILLGNHDLWHDNKWDVSSTHPLSVLPGVEIIDSIRSVEMHGRTVHFLPYTDTALSFLDGMQNKDILLSHLAVDGATFNVMAGTKSDVDVEHDGTMVKVTSEIFSNWNQVFLGHYHTQQRVAENVEYIGSPLQLNFGEAFTHKHILIYDMETGEKEYVRNTFSPQHFIIPECDVDKYEIKNNFICVLVDDLSKSEIVELQARLKEMGPASLEIKQNEKQGEEVNLVEEAKAILFKQDEMLEKYISINENTSLDRNRLLSIGRTICGL